MMKMLVYPDSCTPLDLSISTGGRTSRRRRSSDSDEFSDDSIINNSFVARQKRKGCNPYKKSLMKRYCE
jgi:hypothetical protein